MGTAHHFQQVDDSRPLNTPYGAAPIVVPNDLAFLPHLGLLGRLRALLKPVYVL